MELPDEIISKIMTYHSNVRFDKDELLDSVKLRKTYYECTNCATKGNIYILYNLLDSDERVGVLFFKWVVKHINPEWYWRDLYYDHYTRGLGCPLGPPYIQR
uniref:Uncharacterized protein n=1 Tax=viral metagenome TaxID=1070528 RepID=A0A6C0JUE1_9ZZZZ